MHRVQQRTTQRHHTIALCSPGDEPTTSTSTTLEQQQAQQQQHAEDQPAAGTAVAAAASTTNGAGTNGTSAAKDDKDDKDAPKHRDWVPDASSLAPLQFTPLTSSQRGWTNFKLAFALPWRRFKPEAVLTFKLEGEISDKLQGRFSPGFSMPQILDSLEKAAVDPRIKGIAVEINPLAVRVFGVGLWVVFECATEVSW